MGCRCCEIIIDVIVSRLTIEQINSPASIFRDVSFVDMTELHKYSTSCTRHAEEQPAPLYGEASLHY